MGYARLNVGRARNGLGLFATKQYRRNQVIVRIAGRIFPANVVTKAGGTFANNCFRFGPETYLDPGIRAGAYLNHSCEPNAAIRKTNNRLFLFASRAIRPRQEIAIDYSTLLGDDDIWTMRCKCGCGACRKTIRGFGSLPATLRKRYADRGMVPRFILDTLLPHGSTTSR